MTTMSKVITAQDGRGGEGVLGQPLRVLPLFARPRRWSWQCLEVPLCRLSEWRWAWWGQLYSDHKQFQFLLLFPLAIFITLLLRWKFSDPLLGDVAPRWTSSFLRRAHSGTIRQVRRSADITYRRNRWSKCKLWQKLLTTWQLAPLDHCGRQYTTMWTTLGGTHSTHPGHISSIMDTTWRHLAPTEHHLGTMWTTIGFYFLINWRPPGNTWLLLSDHLLTPPLFYIANWRPPNSWLLVERTYSNTGYPKINHFKSEQIPSSTASCYFQMPPPPAQNSSYLKGAPAAHFDFCLDIFWDAL